MTPAPGERLQRFVGDRLQFSAKIPSGPANAAGWQARLRTNLGRAGLLRREIIEAHAKGAPLAGASWRDLPMRKEGDGWSLELPLTEVGFFKAKAYLLDPKGWQHWPDGPDVGISVHPDAYRTRNIIYCAFPRLFGSTKSALSTRNEKLETQIQQIEEHGFTILPASGKLRDLIQHLPHIIDVLGCRILHLLPVNPTPTTYARFGRFGSPYAALDLTAIDPALVVFDRRTTGVDQFRELTYAAHCRGARVFLDIVINHTGWGSVLQEKHPEWFLRHPDGTFASPGAWGVTWEDLVELKHDNVALWDKLADMLLVWCRRGVDGFRCDAGYKVPVPAWQYIVARVQEEFPETVFLLEGLGGPWEATEALLTEGGMQWAYSELFQNYSGHDVAWYLDYALRQSARVGLYVHYSETHDNNRLADRSAPGQAPLEAARRGREWSLLRNRLCALTSVSGGFGFTCGVEWLATEKIRVHGSTGLAWGNQNNIVPELARLNCLLSEHPCFFDGAKLTRVSALDSPVYGLLRESDGGRDVVLVLVNTDPDRAQTLTLHNQQLKGVVPFSCDLLGQALPETAILPGERLQIALPGGSAYCLSAAAEPAGLAGEAYRQNRARAAWGLQILSRSLSAAQLGSCDWRFLAEVVDRSPFRFLSAMRHMDGSLAATDLRAALERALAKDEFPNVVCWSLVDQRRVTPVPSGHWLMVEDSVPFRASLGVQNETASQNVISIAAGRKQIAAFPPQEHACDARLTVERYDGENRPMEASIRYLAREPQMHARRASRTDLVLLTNGIGGMARICVDLGRVQSKYDCVLAANLHPALPVDRHVFAKRVRVWVNADGFISPLDFQNMTSFEAGPPAVWHFVANAGDGRTVAVRVLAEMLEGRNTTRFEFARPTAAHAAGKQLPADADVRLTVRVDVEDRNFHWETQRNSGAEHHFSTHTHLLESAPVGSARPAGFSFTPAADRQLRVFATAGQYHPQPEWSVGIPHPVEQTRGQAGYGDAYSPGWFELPLPAGANVGLIVTAGTTDLETVEETRFGLVAEGAERSFEAQLIRAARAFVVRRDSGKTVIAGYPWFLDWGRDTFICARGLLAAGMMAEVKQILVTFARFEEQGTLPNTIFGEDASNRDTSDAPLWFGMVCEELAELEKDATFYQTVVDSRGRTILDVLESIAIHYEAGTPNGIRMDVNSGLIWSPSHFTWMDTNYPAGTAREGYPIEIQALWIRLLKQLARISPSAERRRWGELAEQARQSLEQLFWLGDRGWYADVLIGLAGQSAAQSIASDALRSNCLFAVSLGVADRDRSKRSVEAALRYLIVPGALRSLAPLPVSVPLPIYSSQGALLNDPTEPYRGRYEGDEDTQRKPAYHNGTAWTWTLPSLCEAMVRAWNFEPEAVAAARAYLGSVDRILAEGCMGQIPEILDGDAPHLQRGCDAQCWGVTEAIRVWKLLEAASRAGG